MLRKWVLAWNPFMLRQAQHERIPLAPTDFFRITVYLFDNYRGLMIFQGEMDEIRACATLANKFHADGSNMPILKKIIRLKTHMRMTNIVSA
ncbi:MAG: hypothetical protein ISR72_11575 [Methylobacter sp.]|nr:hypothetical protein [Methylobacter sp.]